MKRQTEPLRTDLVVRSKLGFYVGATRVRLLEAIAEHGSISRAAKVVPLSYKAAWDAIDEMNNLAPLALVTRSVGGRQGGGAWLTPYGVKMVALYRLLEKRRDSDLDRLAGALDGVAETHARELQSLLARLAVRTSARNQFIGSIESLRGLDADVDTEAIIRIDDALSLCAVTASDTVERLELRQGMQLVALVPSTAVFLTTETGVRHSTRNAFAGRVLHMHLGVINAEVTIELPGGRTLTATVTRTAAAEFGLADGTPATALFKASGVVLLPLQP